MKGLEEGCVGCLLASEGRCGSSLNNYEGEFVKNKKGIIQNLLDVIKLNRVVDWEVNINKVEIASQVNLITELFVMKCVRELYSQK